MNVGSSAVQIALTVGGLGLTFMMYELWQKQKQNLAANNGDNGLDPNFPGGKPINPTSPVDTNDFMKPSCQTWNHLQNLFENAGHPEWDGDQQLCFNEASIQGSIVRYVDPKGNISYNLDNPLNTPQDEKGKCFFWDGNRLFSFPDYGGYTAPNRSSRLCFDSSLNQTEAGIYFERTGDGVQIWNPNVSWGDFSQLVFPAGLYGDQASLVPSTQDHCEVFRGFPSKNPTVTSKQMNGFAASSDTMGKDLTSCLQLPNSRYWQASANRIVYTNPNNNKMVETPILQLSDN